MKNYKKIFLIRNILKFFAFVFLIIAFLGFSWGTYLVPVQKSSASVSFVFDVSNSMNARDCQNGKSRLESAALYASKILSKIQENGKTNISVVLAKGDGVNVIPLTEDYEIIYSLLNVMNTSLVSVPGTSLGKGIIAAKNSFSAEISSANKIWLFTDGEETDGQLAAAIEDCIKSGISLSIVGFGSETETEILAGDGKTKIKSALRKEELLETIYSIGKKYPYFINQTKVLYIDAEEKGSAVKLLTQVLPDTQNYGEKSDFMTYESQKVPRFRVFLIIAILLYMSTFVITEFDFSILRRKKSNEKQSNNKQNNSKKSMLILLVLITSIVFTGCNGNKINQSKYFNGKKIILNGLNAFQRKKYNQAISYFMKAEEKAILDNNKILLDYAVYDLATSYIMQNEDETAARKFTEISSDAPEILKYAAFYNSGIIAYRNGNIEDAAVLFRKALEVDNSKIEAKVNLELSVNQIEIKARQKESKINSAQEDNSDFNDEESSIFEHIKENDKNQWKSLPTDQTLNLAEDY